MTDPNKPPVDKKRQNRNLLLAVGAVVLVGVFYAYQNQKYNTSPKMASQEPPPVQTSVGPTTDTAGELPALTQDTTMAACQKPLKAIYHKAMDQNNTLTDLDKTGYADGKYTWSTREFICTVDDEGRVVVKRFAEKELITNFDFLCRLNARRVVEDDGTSKFTAIKIVRQKAGLTMTGKLAGQPFSCQEDATTEPNAQFRNTAYFDKRQQIIADQRLREDRRTQAADADLLIKSWHCNLDSGYMKFVGEVVNQTDEAITNLEAVGEVYDKDGLVDTSEALIDYHNLRPGETSPFSTLVDTGGRGNNCKISFKTFDGTPVESAEAVE